MRNTRKRMVGLSEKKRNFGRKDGFDEIHGCAKAGIQIRSECSLTGKLIEGRRPPLPLPLSHLGAA